MENVSVVSRVGPTVPGMQKDIGEESPDLQPAVRSIHEDTVDRDGAHRGHGTAGRHAVVDKHGHLQNSVIT